MLFPYNTFRIKMLCRESIFDLKVLCRESISAFSAYKIVYSPWTL